MFSVLAIILLASFFVISKNINEKKAEAQNKLFAYSNESLFRPLMKNTARDIDLNITNGLLVMVNSKTNKEKILYEKNPDVSNPIASMSKLMTAIVALEAYDLEQPMLLGAKDIAAIVSTGGNPKALKNASLKDLLNIMLIESNNDAANALANQMERGKFVEAMNKKSKEMGLSNTIFYNPSGLDEDDSTTNRASANDLKKIIIYIMAKHKIIPEICATPETDYFVNDILFKKLVNTNILLKAGPDYLWGKTGYTKEANGCIILVLKRPFSFASEGKNEYLISVIMGAGGKVNRFIEAEKLENWIINSFIW